MKKVYLHLDNKGNPFYVGKGNKYRTYDTHNRSKEWNDIAINGFDVIILEDNLTSNEAIEIEKYWINRIGRIVDGGSLVNKSISEKNKGYFRNNEPKIHFHKRNNSWSVRHSIDGVRKWIGSYKTEQEAIEVVEKINK
jgi:hypothetical protein